MTMVRSPDNTGQGTGRPAAFSHEGGSPILILPSFVQALLNPVQEFSREGGSPIVPSFVQALLNPVQEYWMDACQRYILTLDVLRQRGNDYLEQAARITPTVLNFSAEVVIDGRTFERPVNYVLVRIEPPAGVTIDPHK